MRMAPRCRDAQVCVDCERAFLAALDGNCRTPIAGQARLVDGQARASRSPPAARLLPLTPPSTWQILFSGLIAKPDGSVIFETSRTGDLADAAKLGDAAGQELKEKCGNDFEAFFGGDDIAPEPVSSTSGKKTDGLGGYVDS